jgi:O-antigen/teichoic acid export membrane protein
LHDVIVYRSGREVFLTLANKTIGNALAGAIGYAWPVVLALVTTPYIVGKLGNDVYGILALVTSVLGFFAFLDLGVTNASVKYIAESYAKNDVKEISKIIGSSLTVFLTVGMIGGAFIAFLTSTLVQRLLKIPPLHVSDAMFAFYVASCGFVLNMVVGVFVAIPKAIQRYDLTTKVNIVIGTSLTLLIVLAVSLGYGLKQVVVINFVSSVISLVVYLAIAKIHLRNISIKLQFNPTILLKLFRFGMYSLLMIFASALYLQLDRLMIGSFLGAASVAFYVVPATVAMGLHSIVVNLMGVVFPLCSHLYATGEYEKLRELYLKASKYAFIVVISLATPVIVLSTQIMSHWMNAEYGMKSGLVLAILSISAVFTSQTAVPVFILDGMGKPSVNAKFATLSALINICLCLLLIPRIGLTGAALANLGCLTVVILYLSTLDRTIMHVGIKRIVREIWLKPLAIGVIQAICIYFIFMPLIKSRLSLLLGILASIAIYYLALFLFKVFTTEDRDLFKQYISFKLKDNL